MSVLAFQLNASMVTPVLPAMAAALGVDVASVSRVSSWFFLSGAVAGIALGRWSDEAGRRRVLFVALSASLVGTALCAAAPGLGVLLLGRLLQGASGVVFQLAYVLLRERLPPERFAVSLGVITAINGGVGGLDGYGGAWLAGETGFRSIFCVTFVVALLAIGLVWRLVPPDPRPAGPWRRTDWAGAGWLALLLVALDRCLSMAGGGGGPLLAAVAAGTMLLVALPMLVRRQRRAAWPLIPPGFAVSRRCWALLATTLLALAGVFALVNLTLVLLLQGRPPGFGLSPARAALLVLTPPALLGCVSAPAAGWLASRFGWRRMLRGGLLFCALSVAVLLAERDRLPVLLGCVALLGIGYNGLVLTTLNGLGTLLSPAEAPALLPGLNGAAFGIGAGLGIAVAAPYAAAATDAGFTTAILIALGFTLTATLASLLIEEPPGRP
ncbi:MFS transporter [Rhizosaccharibacter radicis]|uniref:MFS transporter n=1 Tax=Rhizosaccharibacter radicis TaxID=2782605 RepID=A0ABT1VZV2_9PROT|nr:MFS transporter [Acetobacteraceae bacterium KSS12]